MVAVCMSTTSVAEWVSEVMSHTPATFCIQEPTLDISAAIDRLRKTAWRSELQVEVVLLSSQP